MKLAAHSKSGSRSSKAGMVAWILLVACGLVLLFGFLGDEQANYWLMALVVAALFLASLVIRLTRLSAGNTRELARLWVDHSVGIKFPMPPRKPADPARHMISGKPN